MPRLDLRRMAMTLPLAVLCVPLLLAGCGGGGQTTGNSVEMRDMDVVDGTVNDSMTDLDAVKADGVGAVSNTGSASRPAPPSESNEEESPEAETVAAE